MKRFLLPFVLTIGLSSFVEAQGCYTKQLQNFWQDYCLDLCSDVRLDVFDTFPICGGSCKVVLEVTNLCPPPHTVGVRIRGMNGGLFGLPGPWWGEAAGLPNGTWILGTPPGTMLGWCPVNKWPDFGAENYQIEVFFETSHGGIGWCQPSKTATGTEILCKDC